MNIFKNCRSRILPILIIIIILTTFVSGRADDRILNRRPVRFGHPLGFDRSLLIGKQEIKMMSTAPPSKAKAFLLSLALPGAGEYYAGSKKMARIFLGAEILLWATYFTFRAYGNQKKDDYQSYAVAHAGIDPSGKDHAYFVNIENYDNIRDYNEAKLRQRDVSAVYPETQEYAWDWDSDASRQRFERLRYSSDAAYTRALFVIGGVILNHVISGIDAARLARKSGGNTNRIQVGVAGVPEGGVVFSFSTRL